MHAAAIHLHAHTLAEHARTLNEGPNTDACVIFDPSWAVGGGPGFDDQAEQAAVMDGAELSARSVGSADGIAAGLLITTNSRVSALLGTRALFGHR